VKNLLEASGKGRRVDKTAASLVGKSHSKTAIICTDSQSRVETGIVRGARKRFASAPSDVGADSGHVASEKSDSRVSMVLC
jgi:hypothetical protein